MEQIINFSWLTIKKIFINFTNFARTVYRKLIIFQTYVIVKRYYDSITHLNIKTQDLSIFS